MGFVTIWIAFWAFVGAAAALLPLVRPYFVRLRTYFWPRQPEALPPPPEGISELLEEIHGLLESIRDAAELSAEAQVTQLQLVRERVRRLHSQSER